MNIHSIVWGACQDNFCLYFLKLDCYVDRHFFKRSPGSPDPLCNVEFFEKAVYENAEDISCWYLYVTIGVKVQYVFLSEM